MHRVRVRAPCAVTGCRAGLICLDDGRCGEDTPCEQDTQCLDGRLCADAQCVDPCFEDADCPGRQSCDVDTGRCALEGACQDDADCNGQRCADGLCIEMCNPIMPCPGQQTCADGRCFEPEVCELAIDCIGARVCAFNRCIEPCREDADCPGSRQCEQETGLCPEPMSCMADDECDPQRRCVARQCADACVPGECPGGQSCSDGICIEPDRCIGDIDCLGRRLCVRDRCSEPCAENSDCLGSDLCEPESGRCVEFQPECILDSDCPGEAACILGTCREGRCESHRNCADGLDCIDGGCAPPLRPMCRVDADCGNGEVCGDIGRCVKASPCEEDADCDGLRGICYAGQCVDCRVDSDCLPSELCSGYRCESTGFCMVDGDCRGEASTCVDNQCAPRACIGDEYDLRLGSPQLAPRTFTNMVLCDGDVDVYRVELGPDEGISARILHEAGTGDIMLTLRSLDEEAVGVSQVGIARAGLHSRGLPRMIDIIISGRPGSTTPYTLDLRIQPTATCAPDNFEPPVGNASQDRPQQTLGQVPPIVSRLCQGDSDWYTVTVPGGVTMTTIVSSDRLNAVEATMLDPIGRPGPDFENTGRDKRAVSTPMRRTSYRVGLIMQAGADNATNFLDFDIETLPSARDAACLDAPLAVVDSPFWFEPQLAADRFSLTCDGNAAFNDRIARFRIAQRGLYRIITAQPDRGTRLAVRQNCADSATEIACELGSEIPALMLDPGEYSLVIDSPLNTIMGFTITPVE